MDKRNTDEGLLERRIKTMFGKGVTKYGLIDDGDKILVGLSGGKDSMALLELLARRSRIFKPRFSVEAVHVAVTNIGYRSDTDYLRQYCERLGVDFHVVETSFDMAEGSRKPHCFLCSWHRRKALFAYAKQNGCNKIALGHHMDDILETLLMNMTFLGRCDTMRPKLRMNKFEMTIVRPLCLVSERDLQQLARVRGFRKQDKACPHERATRRTDMKRMLAELEQLNPEARYSLWHCIEQQFCEPQKADNAAENC